MMEVYYLPMEVDFKTSKMIMGLPTPTSHTGGLSYNLTL
jgi:hypothetical protein